MDEGTSHEFTDSNCESEVSEAREGTSSSIDQDELDLGKLESYALSNNIEYIRQDYGIIWSIPYNGIQMKLFIVE
jgi:hypothetical protein